MSDQIIISLLLLLLVIFFIWGKFRYDAVALVMLSIFVVLGYVAPSNAFSGLGHPAVVTIPLLGICFNKVVFKSSTKVFFANLV